MPITAIALLVLGATTATAAGVSMTSSATLDSSQARAVAAAWGNKPPYAVSFTCNVAGCKNFTAASTTTTGIGRTVVMTVCSQTTRMHTISITEKGGGSVSAASKTTWRAGSYC